MSRACGPGMPKTANCAWPATVVTTARNAAHHTKATTKRGSGATGPQDGDTPQRAWGRHVTGFFNANRVRYAVLSAINFL